MSRTRRELFSSWFGAVHNAAQAARSQTPRPIDALIRPPGALQPDERFLAACSGCGDCVTACPPHALFTVEISKERKVPTIDPIAQPCLLCTDVPCVSACPDGALESVDSADRIRIGIARVNPRTCVTFKGQVCDRCFRACPYPHAALMMIGGRPIVGSGACTGCGLCERVCPERPRAISVIAERHLVPGLRVPRVEVGGEFAG